MNMWEISGISQYIATVFTRWSRDDSRDFLVVVFDEWKDEVNEEVVHDTLCLLNVDQFSSVVELNKSYGTRHLKIYENTGEAELSKPPVVMKVSKDNVNSGNSADKSEWRDVVRSKTTGGREGRNVSGATRAGRSLHQSTMFHHYASVNTNESKVKGQADADGGSESVVFLLTKVLSALTNGANGPVGKDSASRK
jgi:hypothetical protein